jgi:16S rRNA (adenine1518-N6/adenine1519-N6)-dimethyltransferase
MAKQRGVRLGQVFLSDARVERRIVDSLHLTRSDAVLEIGAGPGNMTARLAAAGGKVVAVEVDPPWAARLRERFQENERVAVIEADILTVAVDEIAHSLGREAIKVFGNLPYYITSPILLHLFRCCDTISEIVVMVQREVAERIVAAPGSRDYGLFSVTCQYYTQPKLLFKIPPSAFRNPPKVDSELVRMAVAPQGAALGVTDEKEFWAWMKAAFAQKRKTLVNNWKPLCDPARLAVLMEEQDLDPRARAEALSLAELAALYKATATAP